MVNLLDCANFQNGLEFGDAEAACKTSAVIADWGRVYSEDTRDWSRGDLQVILHVVRIDLFWRAGDVNPLIAMRVNHQGTNVPRSPQNSPSGV